MTLRVPSLATRSSRRLATEHDARAPQAAAAIGSTGGAPASGVTDDGREQAATARMTNRAGWSNTMMSRAPTLHGATAVSESFGVR